MDDEIYTCHYCDITFLSESGYHRHLMMEDKINVDLLKQQFREDEWKREVKRRKANTIILSPLTFACKNCGFILHKVNDLDNMAITFKDGLPIINHVKCPILCLNPQCNNTIEEKYFVCKPCIDTLHANDADVTSIFAQWRRHKGNEFNPCIKKTA